MPNKLFQKLNLDLNQNIERNHDTAICILKCYQNSSSVYLAVKITNKSDNNEDIKSKIES
jgi:hypothetical protein